MAAERIHQVFISSTFVDLAEERQEVLTALLELEAMPAGMELFPAADEDAWSLIQRVIAECDYYLLVIGGRYGSIDSETNLSYTEMEYDFAVEQGKPVLAFLHGKPDKIEYGKSEPDESVRKKLEAFRQKVEGSKHVKYWTSPEDLGGKVSRSFARFRKDYPMVGWIRGDAVASSESLAELNSLRKQLEATQEQLRVARTSPPPGTSDLAQGSDPVDVSIWWRARSYEDDAPFSGTRHGDWLDDSLTWDQLFEWIGVLMLDEAEEGDVRERLNGHCHIRLEEKVKGIAQEASGTDDVRSIEIGVAENQFSRILIQLRALGLIEKSERKRSVSDAGTYWTLTAYGDSHLTNLLAHRRNAGSSIARPGDEEDSRSVDQADSPASDAQSDEEIQEDSNGEEEN